MQDDWREHAVQLADELRAISEALAVSDVDAAALADAVAQARALRRRLEGPRRPRWYEGYDPEASPGDDARHAYLDQSPIRGRINPIAPPLEVEPGLREDGSPCVVGRARLSAAYEGPPHGVHGGWVAALFDDLLGQTAGLARVSRVTATLDVRYRHVTPIDEELRFTGWIAEDRGNRLVARATCHAGETLTADARGLFVRVDFAEIQERMRQRRAGSTS